MLPVHNMSGYCDIQGRRKTIEDFHSVHLTNDTFYYGIFDGHSGNFAAKYAASSLYKKLERRLSHILQQSTLPLDWKVQTGAAITDIFAEIHEEFLTAILSAPRKMDQSGTTATIVHVTPQSVVLASLGDSRAVLGAAWRGNSSMDELQTSALQLTKDHVASDPVEQEMVESRGGFVSLHNNVYRVNGTLAITRSIGGEYFPLEYLSRRVHVCVPTLTSAMYFSKMLHLVPSCREYLLL